MKVKGNDKYLNFHFGLNRPDWIVGGISHLSFGKCYLLFPNDK